MQPGNKGFSGFRIETGQPFLYQITLSPSGDEVALVFRFAQPAIFALQAALKLWLFVHVPLTYSMIVLAVCHLVTASAFASSI